MPTPVDQWFQDVGTKAHNAVVNAPQTLKKAHDDYDTANREKKEPPRRRESTERPKVTPTDKWMQEAPGRAYDAVANAPKAMKKAHDDYDASNRAKRESSPKRATYEDKRREDLANYNYKKGNDHNERMKATPRTDSAKSTPSQPAPSNYDVSKSVPKSESTPKQRSFASAFAAARMDGKKEFTWNGKRYHTRRADGK